MTAKRAPSGRSGARCPICGKPASPPHAPFCSRRCADVDLARWLGERYVISRPLNPGKDAPLASEEEPTED
ncbi:MAG: DNA gyrase inhibitor YacG [Alphaproteobacteria bacterium]